LTVIFTHLGSGHVKDARKTLMKLSQGRHYDHYIGKRLTTTQQARPQSMQISFRGFDAWLPFGLFRNGLSEIK